MKITTSEEMKSIENQAMESFAVPSSILMENAAAGAAMHCMQYLKDIKNPSAVVFCSKGNNGGDGFAAARHLFIKNVNVNIIIYGDISNGTSDCILNYTIAENMGIPIYEFDKDEVLYIADIIKNSDLCVDALIGTGLKKELYSDLDFLVKLINENSKYTISIDIPTGINSDTGAKLSNAVKADETVTFHLPKAGHFLSAGAVFSGKLKIAHIGIGHSESEKNLKYNVLSDYEAKALLPKRKMTAHKGSFGKVFVFAGSKDMAGAAFLNCMTAYAAGAGIVRLFSVKECVQTVRSLLPEALSCSLEGKEGFLSSSDFAKIKDEINLASVIAVGSGIGRNKYSSGFLDKLIEYSDIPMVLDADALNIMSENKAWFARLKKGCVITPHIGEMSRLSGLTSKEITDDMISSAVNFSKKYNVITVLKDFRSVIADPSGNVFINTTGTAAMAKGGSGDCLTGTISAFIAQGLSGFDAAVLGCYINGLAGEEAEKRLGAYSVMARDIAESIPAVIKKID